MTGTEVSPGGSLHVGADFGQYRLDRLIGAGAMGEVWKAHDRINRRDVAIKLLAPHLARDAESRKRFEREARLASRLRDPHIVPIHRYGDIDGRLYVDMQLIDGVDLEQLLLIEGALEPQRAMAIIEQIAHALATAHKDGLVHRDVKPSNILLATGHDGRDIAYLADFGISKTLEVDPHTRTSALHVVGTLGYMAPEQFSGKAGPSSDLYSLGCVLFECLTGRQPFEDQAKDPVTAMSAHVWAEPPRVSEHAPWLSTSLDGVVLRALQKEPSARQASVMDFAAAGRTAVGRSEFIRPTATGSAGTPRRFGGRLRSRRSMRIVHQPEPKPTDPIADPAAAWARPRPTPRRAVIMGIAIATAVVLLASVTIAVVSLTRDSAAAPGPAGPVSAWPAPAPAAVSLAEPTVGPLTNLPGRPETVAVSPDGSRAYLTTSTGPGALRVVNTADNTEIGSVPIPGVPRFVATNPSTGNVYVSYNDEQSDRLRVAGIDAQSLRIVKTIDSGQPADRKMGQTWLFVFAMSRDGTRLYLPHHTRSVVSVIDTVSNEAIAQIPMPRNPHSVALTPDGTKAYVAAHSSGQVEVIDTKTNTVTGSISMGTGTAPHDLAVSPDGRTLHVVNFDAGTLTAVSTADNRRLGSVPVGQHPQSVIFSRDGRHSYAVDNAGSSVVTVDTASTTVTSTVRLPLGAAMIALARDGRTGYVASREAGVLSKLTTAS